MKPQRNLGEFGYLSIEELHGTAASIVQLLNAPDLPDPMLVRTQLPLPIMARLLHTLGRLAEVSELAANLIDQTMIDHRDIERTGMESMSVRAAPDLDDVQIANLSMVHLKALVSLMAELRAAKPYEPPRVQQASRIVLPGAR
jgi:hypothetical protein